MGSAQQHAAGRLSYHDAEETITDHSVPCGTSNIVTSSNQM